MRTSLENQITTLGWLLHGTGVLALVAMLGAYAWCVALPLQESSKAGEQRITQLEAMLAKAPQVRAEHLGYQGELDTLRRSVAETQRRLPQELREDEFLDHVRVAAGKTGVEVGAYQLGAIQKLESYSKAELTFQCQGSFASICRFLDEIDHFARITEISNLQIESTENFAHYPLQVTFVLYFGGSNHDRRKGEVL